MVAIVPNMTTRVNTHNQCPNSLLVIHEPRRQRNRQLGFYIAHAPIVEARRRIGRVRARQEAAYKQIRSRNVPKINFDIAHTLSTDEAKQRLQRFIEFSQSNSQVSEFNHNWDGDTLSYDLKTFGIKILGNIAIQPEKLAVDCDLPFSAMMFKGKIESEMKQQIERLLR